MTSHLSPLPYIHRGDEEAGFFAHALNQGDSLGLLTGCPDNMPPAEAPYMCLIPVKDYWRMIAALCQRNNCWHYGEGIEPDILDDIRSRRCVLVFDLSNEGPAYFDEIFDELFRWIEHHRLPSGQIVWLAQNRSMEAQCRAKAGPRATWVKFAYYDFFVKMIAALFAPGSHEQILGTDPETFIGRMFDPASKDRLLLCLNATPRLPRVLAVSALIHHGLLDGSLVSFPGMTYVKDHESAERVRAYIAANPTIAYLTRSVETTLGLAALKVDEFAEKGNALFAKVDVRPYERTFFSLVTETEFSDGSVDRVTEKIVKPFCLGHPSLVIGNPRATRFMTEIGFQDWDGVIDREYDTEADPATRFGMVFDEVLRQVRGIRGKPDEWLGRVREVGAANIRHATSGKLLARYCELYDRPLVTRLAGMISAPAA